MHRFVRHSLRQIPNDVVHRRSSPIKRNLCTTSSEESTRLSKEQQVGCFPFKISIDKIVVEYFSGCSQSSPFHLGVVLVFRLEKERFLLTLTILVLVEFNPIKLLMLTARTCWSG